MHDFVLLSFFNSFGLPHFLLRLFVIIIFPYLAHTLIHNDYAYLKNVAKNSTFFFLSLSLSLPLLSLVAEFASFLLCRLFCVNLKLFCF